MEEPRSITSKRLLADIARDGGGDVEKAATGDPAAKSAKKKLAPAVKSAPKSPKRRKPTT
jgi:hypothetical protein